MNNLKIWWLKYFLNKRVVMVVFANGTNLVREVKTTVSDGKSYVETFGRAVGFLDNPRQQTGEFRKGLSSPDLVRWFDL